MTGAQRQDARPPEDLTGRARIRDAALEEFTARGVRGATIRGIAERAGVSPALVQHHFGTKEALRTACDEHVVAYFRAGVAEGFDRGALADPEFLRSLYRSGPPLMRYLARALVDGSPAAAMVFDELVVLTERYLGKPDGAADPRTRAVVFTAMRLGVTVLHEHISRALGADMFSPETAMQVNRATLDIVAPNLFPSDCAAHVQAGLASLERNHREQETGDE